MRRKHRSPVVALGALCLVACLSLLPATSGAYMVRWGDTGDTLPGDPDSPDGGNVVFKVPFSQYLIRISFLGFSTRTPIFLTTISRVSHREVGPSR